MYRDYEHTIVITNRGLVQGDFFEQMERVISLHPHAVILREKDLTDEAYEKLAKRLLELCQREGVSCFLHSRVSVARHLDCRKIHLSIRRSQLWNRQCAGISEHIFMRSVCPVTVWRTWRSL